MTAKPPSAPTLSPDTPIETNIPVIFTEVRDSNNNPVAEGTVTFDKTLTVKGTAELNKELWLRDGLTRLNDVTSSASGNWVKQLTLSDFKRYSLSAIEKNPPQNYSSPAKTFVLATETPIFGKVTGNDGEILDGGTYYGDWVEITGNAIPGDAVEAFDSDTSMGKTTTVDRDGQFKLMLDELSPGTYIIKIKAPSGKESTEFKLIVAVKKSLSLDEVLDDEGNSVDEGQSTIKKTLTIKGKARGNREITLLGGQPASVTVTAKADGDWEHTFTNLPDGPYSLTARTNYDPVETTAPPRTFNVVLDIKLSLDDVLDDESNSVDEGQSTIKKTLTIKGKARGNREITLLGGQPASVTVTADADGDWEHTFSNLPVGPYSLTARTNYEPVETTAPPRTFNVVLDIKLSLDDVLDDQGNSVDEGQSTIKKTLTIKGKARGNGEITLLGGQPASVTVTADGDGDWEHTFTNLPDGPYSLTARTNYEPEETTAPPRTFKIDAIITPHNTRVYDSGGLLIPDNGSTRDNYVTVRGDAAPREAIKLRINGVIDPEPERTNEEGKWARLVQDLDYGTTYEFIAVAAYGNNAESNSWTIAVESALVPTLDDVTDPESNSIGEGATTFASTLTVSGSALPNQKVEILDGSTRLTETDVGADGKFSKDITGLRAKLYSLTIRALYGQNPVSAPPRTFNVETAVRPTISAIKGAFGQIIPNATTIERAVTVEGRANKDQKVEIWDGETRLAEAQVDPYDFFSIVLSGLTTKTYNLRIKPLYGNGVPDSEIRSFTVINWPDSVTTFNDGTLGGWQKGAAFTQSFVAERVLRNTTTALSGHAGVVLSKAFVFDANEEYSLTFRVRNFSTQTASLTPKFFATMTMSPNEQVLIPVFEVPKDGQWHFLEARFSVPRTNNYTLNIKSNENRGGGSGADGGNDYELDDIIVRQIRPEWSDSITDFNDGSLGSWNQGITAKGAEIINGVFRNETKRLTGNAGIVLFKYFRFEKDRTYLFSYRVRNFSGEAANRPPRLSVSSGGSTILPEYSIPRDGEWHYMQREFSVPTTHDSIQININSHENRGGGSGSDGGNDYEIDDIVVLKLR
ncbi:hypothetical protein [Pseudomonas synxantha]|uniref:Phage gp45-like n=1 Tax=Pseudomonas synxantha TaxID=47883 RepID=A0ACC6JST9_9PSED|nr:hypothetical protein [Pseudomonas synxantha]MDR6609603.1 phage gp45-like [Pseudomonas synxantha]